MSGRIEDCNLGIPPLNQIIFSAGVGHGERFCKHQIVRTIVVKMPSVFRLIPERLDRVEPRAFSRGNTDARLRRKACSQMPKTGGAIAVMMREKDGIESRYPERIERFFDIAVAAIN